MSCSQDAAPPLHHTRAEKFRLLDDAIASHTFSRRSWRVSAHAYIKIAELHTTNDGWSHLRQQDMEELAGCSDEKLKAIRDELTRIGWIEVSNGCPACGYPKAIAVRVNWPTIAAAIKRPKPSGDDSGKPEPSPEKPESCPGNPERRNKELTSMGAPCLSPMKGDGACATDGLWPSDISREMIRSPRTVDRLYRGAVSRGFFPDSREARVGVHGAALYTIRRKGIEKPGAYFQSLVKRKWWLIPPNERGGMPDAIDADAHRIIRELDKPARESPASGTTDADLKPNFMATIQKVAPTATALNNTAATAGRGGA